MLDENYIGKDFLGKGVEGKEKKKGKNFGILVVQERSQTLLNVISQ